MTRIIVPKNIYISYKDTKKVYYNLFINDNYYQKMRQEPINILKELYHGYEHSIFPVEAEFSHIDQFQSILIDKKEFPDSIFIILNNVKYYPIEKNEQYIKLISEDQCTERTVSYMKEKQMNEEYRKRTKK